MISRTRTADKPSPAWRERVASATSRVRVDAPDGPPATATGAFTLTRLALARHPLPPSGRGFAGAALALFLLGVTALPAQAESLKIGLAEDPDTLDPVISRAFVARIVMASFCDKLFDIDAKLNIVPQLGTGWSWSADGKQLTITLRSGVVFQDGEPFDAAAAKFNIERDINFPGSNRRSELPPIDSVDVTDPLTVRIALKAPFAPLVGVLTDRAGMMLSPKAASAPGADMANHPVCAGPFRLVEHVPQDRIVVERFDRYWNKDHVKLDRITYLPLPDSTVRLANLKSGDLDMIERVLPTDLPDLEANPKFATASVPELGYYGITINLANGPAAKTPFGSDARVRQAFDLAIDRDAINQVVFGGKAIPDEQFTSPDSPFHDDALKPPVRDIAKAKALLQAAGVPNPLGDAADRHLAGATAIGPDAPGHGAGGRLRREAAGDRIRLGPCCRQTRRFPGDHGRLERTARPGRRRLFLPAQHRRA